MYDRSAFGYQPPSISVTRRQLIAAGFPFCSLQATTQHLQPMHLPMSTWKRYCSPGPGGREGMRDAAATSAGASSLARGVRMNVEPFSVARVKRGRDISLIRTYSKTDTAGQNVELLKSCRLIVLT